jgi:formate--tetrahydrofolate ligase
MIVRSSDAVSSVPTPFSAGTSVETPPRPFSPWHCEHANCTNTYAPAATIGSTVAAPCAVAVVASPRRACNGQPRSQTIPVATSSDNAREPTSIDSSTTPAPRRIWPGPNRSCGLSAPILGAPPDGGAGTVADAAPMQVEREAPVLRPIGEVADELGLEPDEVLPYGRHAAKIEVSALDRVAAEPDGKLVCVTSVTPTKAGEGKTTTAISLADGLRVIGERPVLALREPSLGPIFGIKGGGTGGGRSQLGPMELINLHFTGDIHAIGAANNLLAAVVESHLLHGNELGLDPHAITWRRCLDMDDRALRKLVVGLGGRTNGSPRETGFDITAASEVMAIVAVARDHADLRRRLGAITVGETVEGEPVTAEQLKCAGSMAALLTEALKPNLVQTLEGAPALVHCGPFANIAHGNNSLLADRLALKFGDVAVTESGFGAEMGFEKFVDILCRRSGLAPSTVVVVATVQALKHHGGEPDDGLRALERGAANLAANLAIVHEVGLEAVVAVNRHPGDTTAEVHTVRRLAIEAGALAAAVNDGYELGGDGAVGLAESVVAASESARPLRLLYEDGEPLARKIEAVATRAYGAAGIELSPAAERQAARLEAEGSGGLPVCIAKTHLSLSHDPTLANAPKGFTLPVRELRAYTGAGWVVALCGEMQTMPGLPADPAASRIEVDDRGRVLGLR